MTMGKLINKIPGSRVLISSLPSWAVRTHVKCEACRAFYLFFETSLINSITYWGSLWFTGRILFYLMIRGFYHIGVRNDRNNMVYKGLKSPYAKRKEGCGGAASNIQQTKRLDLV